MHDQKVETKIYKYKTKKLTITQKVNRNTRTRCETLASH